MPQIKNLGFNIHQFQLADYSTPYRSTGYIIQEEKIILIETGPSSANYSILSALKVIGIHANQVDAVAVSHIHLDHAGGAGILMGQFPNAELLVHEKGKKHLVDPKKLIAGAKLVYGDDFDSIFSPVLPVPGERIRTMRDEEQYDLGNGRKITFLDSPGHAFHHLALFDQMSKGIFSGDSVGIYYNRLFEKHQIPFCLPIAAPPQFEPKIMKKTLTRLASLKPERIYFTHYGAAESGKKLIQQAITQTDFLQNECVQYFKKSRDREKLYHFIRQKLVSDLIGMGVPEQSPELLLLERDIGLNVQGIILYVEKQEKAQA